MIDEYKNNITNALKVIHEFGWLLDSSVLDIYVNDHWNDLPQSWRSTLCNTEPEELGGFIAGLRSNHVWPLSMLVVRSCLSHINIPRTPMISTSPEQSNSDITCIAHPNLKNLFTMHVKPKKRHEISLMAATCASTAKHTHCDYVVDFGSGLGHLARVLAYRYKLKVCCLEAQNKFSEQARKLDLELERAASKHLPCNIIGQRTRPTHLNIVLKKETQQHIVVKDLRAAFGIPEKSSFSFGIVGLHPCGDLAAILLSMFLNCPEAKFINIVGCCYMKLTTDGECSDFRGYPLSKFVSTSSIPHTLSYASREVACHALEMYCEKLQAGEYSDLKVHAYRATLEKIIVSHWPHLKHSAMRSVKHTDSMTFQQYCNAATSKLGIDINNEDITSEETAKYLVNWKKVVMYFMMRLYLAPLIETVILLDRMVYLMELGTDCEIVPVFNPLVSPRNHILTAVKKY